MPRQEFTRPEPKSDIYALLMILSAVFILAATILVYAELANDYDFFGEERVGAVGDAGGDFGNEEAAEEGAEEEGAEEGGGEEAGGGDD